MLGERLTPKDDSGRERERESKTRDRNRRKTNKRDRSETLMSRFENFPTLRRDTYHNSSTIKFRTIARIATGVLFWSLFYELLTLTFDIKYVVFMIFIMPVYYMII